MLTENAVYYLAQTPYQYAAKRVLGHPYVAWLLVPQFAGCKLIEGPPAYVTHGGIIGVQDGLTEQTTAALNFTGRYV